MSKILVIDDDPDLVRLMALVLLEKGHDVATASDGEEGLQLAASLLPDVIVTDLLMPNADGYDLLTRLRLQADTATIPVVVVSEMHGKDTRVTAFRMGCDDFLPKPFAPDELCLRVARALRGRRHSSSQLSAQPPGVKMHGAIADLPLSSLLTLFELEKKTGVLELKDAGSRHQLYLKDGKVLHAVDMSSPTRAPLQTMCLALRMKDGKFSLRTLDVTVSDHVGMSTQQLLLEAFRCMDEEDASMRP